MPLRVPTDISLASWIRQLEQEGRLYRFYKTDEWLALRASVMEANHSECAMCREKSPAKYTKAVTVHHVNEVRRRPELALSRTYTDAAGTHDNLLPLCHRCHDIEHGRFYGEKPREKPITEERW